MTERTPRFDTDEIELLFSDAEERPATPVTAALPGAFSAHLPRGVELANVDHPALPFGGRDAPTMFSPHHTVMASAENLRLAVAFDHLELELARLGRRWTTSAPRGRIDALVGDFSAFMRILLEDVELEPIHTRSAETSMLVHDTYVRLITVGGVLREALEARWANAADLESAYAHAEATLDAFTPFVGLADRAMRRICLEAETLEGALRWLSRQLDEEAAERPRAAEAYVPRGMPSSRFRDN